MNHYKRTPMNFQQAPHLFLREVSNLGHSSVMKANLIKEEHRSAQMTIFYDGKVIVFDDVPADKIKDIMVFSSKGTTTSQNHNNDNYAFRFAQRHPSFLARNSANNSLQVPSSPIIYDLPMIRKASLHRFLEKRKDRSPTTTLSTSLTTKSNLLLNRLSRPVKQTSMRIAARAPYQTSNRTNLKKAINESMSWLSLAPQDNKSECSSSSHYKKVICYGV